jgi:hypothetical protein
VTQPRERRPRPPSSSSAATAVSTSASPHPDRTEPSAAAPIAAGNAAFTIPRTTAQEIVHTPAKLGADGSAALAAGGGGATAGGGAADGDAVYSSSYTQRRTREFDLLHDIVRQTRSAFIDVTRRQQADIAEEEAERSERSVIYNKQIKQQQQTLQSAAATAPPVAAAVSSSLLASSLLSAHSLIPSLFSLPLAPANSSVASAVAAVKAAGLSAADREWLRRRATEMSEAIGQLELPDTGRIVLSFDEL